MERPPAANSEVLSVGGIEDEIQLPPKFKANQSQFIIKEHVSHKNKLCECKDTILLVDDNEYNLYALRIMLEIFDI